MLNCKKCGYTPKNENELELHHIIPKFMGGTDKDGRVYLCKKHHGILHKIIPTLIYRFVSKNLKERCKRAIVSFTKRFIYDT